MNQWSDRAEPVQDDGICSSCGRKVDIDHQSQSQGKTIDEGTVLGMRSSRRKLGFQTFLKGYRDYVVAGLKQTSSRKNNNNNNDPYYRRYGWLTFILLFLSHGLSAWSVCCQLVQHYQWLASLSVLPGLTAKFNFWILGGKFLIFFAAHYLVLTLFFYGFGRYFADQEERPKFSVFLADFYQEQQFSLVISLITLVFALLAPVACLSIIVFLTLLDMAAALMGVVKFSLGHYKKSLRIPSYYGIILLLTCYLIVILLLSSFIF